MYEANLDTAVSLLRDPPVNALTRKQVSGLADALSRFPARASDYSELRGLSAWDRVKKAVEAIARGEPYKAMGPQTVNIHLERLSALYDFAVLHGEAVGNPVKGISVAVNSDEEPRRAYTSDELKVIFEGSFYRERLYKKPYQYWMPHLGLYTGARINELAGLAVSDVHLDDGVWAISFKPRPKKEGEPSAPGKDGHRLKNKASIRSIPLHPELIRLGFLDYVESLKKAGQWRVFPELTMCRDGYGKNAGTWYSRYREKIEVTDNDVDFHSFRYSFEGAALRARIRAEFRSVWLGHSVGRGALMDGGAAMTVEAYRADYPASLLLEEVAKKIDFGLELTPYQPITDTAK